ncbi:hypothetical protein KGF57_000511 [Candida theae]|uniref:PH-like domain-containing protein n=1 Tax=Candida theae TaxID=1198502 RepID=A0AAD5BIQ7_9ASCO|nr:uncharacterized protein KGF57_000511 [Candida theae]KAI5967082.1 hypothetical protein KGF57_000511 [Candida theae]
MSSSQMQAIKTLLDNFHQTVSLQNNDLLEILGIAKQLKSNLPPSPNTPSSTLSSIVRGLYTKNNQLLSLISKTTVGFVNANFEMDKFKTFINDLILWMEDGNLLLFEKYIAQLNTVAIDDAATRKRLISPVNNLRDYYCHIDKCTQFLRNPFILEKLSTISKHLRAIYNNYQDASQSKELNNIRFSEIQPFTSSTALKHKEFVSSYFKISQILKRTAHANVSLNGAQIELLLLDLLCTGDYNALAVLEIKSKANHHHHQDHHFQEDSDSSYKSLKYPPFRVNELTLSRISSHTIKLKAINFSSTEDLGGESMSIQFEDDVLCGKWAKYLSKLCPLKRDNNNSNNSSSSPMSEKFLIHSDSSSYNMSGLGINIVSDAELAPKESHILPQADSPASFQELYDPPTPTSLPPTVPAPLGVQSRASLESIRSQYDKSLPIMKKVITGQRNGEEDYEDDEKLFQIINQRKYSDDYSNDELRPKSYQAEYCSPESSPSTDHPVVSHSVAKPVETRQLYRNNVASAPDLRAKPQIYQLSTGSAIDIGNFGQSYQPSFKGYADKKTSRRKSMFTFFKKSSQVDLREESPSEETFIQNANSNGKELQLPQQPTLLKGETKVDEDDANPEKTMTRSVSKIPAPFALPSSTSTYFFKQPVNASETSIAKQDDLLIPQELKDAINSEKTSDDYISESSPKAIKISKWKQQYGKWEMITASENIFVKICVNEEAQKGWFLIFKEEYDEEVDDVVDKPVLLLDLNTSTQLRLSSGSDLQIQAKNSINNETMQIMIRCSKGTLTTEIASNLQKCIDSFAQSSRNHHHHHHYHNHNHHSLTNSSNQASNNTLSSSLMDNPSKSSTYTSLSSISNSINADELSKACILNNPNALHTRQIEMTIRLQKQLHSYAQRNSPSSWKIISMMDLRVDRIIDHQQVVHHLQLTGGGDSISWVISDDRKEETIERIGKAGLLIKISDGEIYMLECRGKKEFKHLYEIF